VPRHVSIFLATAAIVALACGSDDRGAGAAHPAVEDVAIAACAAPVADSAGWSARVTVTNHSSEPSDYEVSVAFGDPDGTGAGDTEDLAVDNLLPGQATVRTVTSDVTEGLPPTVTCSVGTITRTASDAELFPPADASGDVAVAGCVAPAGPGEGWSADLTVTNHSSKPSDYTITVAFDSADGKTQVDTATASADRIEHGASAKVRATSSTARDLPPEVTCRLARIERREDLDDLLDNGVGDVTIERCGRAADPARGWEADLSVTNSTPSAATYLIVVAYVGPDGTSLYSRDVEVAHLASGATAKATATQATPEDGDPGTERTCRISGALRTAG
jgi:hypothetical protein